MKTDSRETAEDYKILVENLNEGIVRVDTQGRIVYANRQFCKIMGYPRKELLGKAAYDLLLGDKESLGTAKKAIDDRKRGKSSKYNLQIKTKSGRAKWISMNGTPLYDKAGKAAGSTGVVTDITKSKQTEAALIASEARFKELVEYLPHPIVVHAGGVVLFVNEATLKFIKVKSAAEVLGKSMFDWVHPDFHKIIKERTHEVLRTGKAAPMMEQLFVDSEGKILTAEVTGTLIDFDKKTALMVTLNDITKRKEAERLRQEEAMKFKNLFNNAHDLIQSVSPKGDFLFVNEAWLKTLGYTRSEVRQLNMADVIHPSSLKHCTKLFARVMKGESVKNIDAAFITKNGETVEVSGNATAGNIGGHIATQGIFRNVTTDKKAQEKLERSEKRYRELVEKMDEGIIQVDMEEVIEYVNKRFCEIVGYRERDIIGKKAENFLIQDEESLKIWTKQLEFRRKGKSSKYEVQFKKKSGEWIWASMNGIPLTDEKGKITGSMGIVTDITEQVHAKEAFTESEERYRTLNEAAFDAIIIGNSKGEIISWNKGAEIIFGYGVNEIIGKPLTTIIPREYKEGHLKGFGRFLRTGKPRYIGQVIDMDGKRKSGEIFPIEINLSSWETKSGKYFSGIIRDISKRKQIEERIIELNEELEGRVIRRTVELEKANSEIRSLLREMHHRVKNNLQIVSSMLNMQAGTADDEKVARIFQDSQDRIQAMALIHENLYLKESLSQISIKEYLEPLINDRIKANSDLRDKIRLKVKLPSLSFKIDTMLPIGLLINELVTNSLKHAYPDHKKGVIKLSIKVDKGNQVELNYSDDGVGFIIEDKGDNPKSLGLVLIDSFVMQLDGEMELNSGKDGTQYSIKFKIPA